MAGSYLTLADFLLLRRSAVILFFSMKHSFFVHGFRAPASAVSTLRHGCLFTSLLVCALASAESAADGSATIPMDVPELAPVQVIVHSTNSLSQINFDPRNPTQPIPAQDGAEILKTIPGFSVIRKGGTDGDPVFRGMVGSRLGILVNGENIMGGCGQRMDPPTAYIFPGAYDRLTVIRGPQSVRNGPGYSAGTVLFEQDSRGLDSEQAEWRHQLNLGSFGRNDQLIDATVGDATVDLQLTATRTAADDYRDGSGDRIHSQYERWSTQATLGWNVDEQNRLELAAVMSDGEAAYADRLMDGVAFDRKNVSLSWLRQEVARFESMEAKLYYNSIDHIMDNFSLREFSGSMMMPNPTISNPKREIFGGRLLFDGLELSETGVLDLGLNFQTDTHSIRSTMNAPLVAMGDFADDACFDTLGFFSEYSWELSVYERVFLGARVDLHRAKDYRATVPLSMMMTAPNPTVGQERTETLPSGFARYERILNSGAQFSVGIGHTQRFPDYWELVSKESVDSLSAFGIEPEKTTQLDLVYLQERERISYSVAVFANQIDDYILVESGVSKGMRTVTVSRNVKAYTWGGEATVQYELTPNWQVDGSLAYVRGDNRTDGIALGQQPPLEARLAFSYTAESWSVGGLLRMVDAQNRVAPQQGNIVGQDISPSAGFAILSLNANWQLNENNRISLGVDNLLDTEYAEHLSRGGSSIAGFPPAGIRVNEPGRNAWVQWSFEY